MIVLPTIPGSGTHLMRDHILAGIETYCRHPYPEEIDGLIDKLNEGWLCVVPVRPFEDIAATWARRGRDPDGFGGWTLAQWYQVQQDLVAPYDPILINITEPDLRDAQLEILEDKIGVKLPHDWPVVSEDGD